MYKQEEFKVDIGDIVSINYEATTDSSLLVLSSKHKGPLKFEVGKFDLIPGLNKHVQGMFIGESKEFVLSCDEAFVSLGIPDMRGISETLKLNWNGSNHLFEPGTGISDVLASGVHCQGTPSSKYSGTQQGQQRHACL